LDQQQQMIDIRQFQAATEGRQVHTRSTTGDAVSIGGQQRSTVDQRDTEVAGAVLV